MSSSSATLTGVRSLFSDVDHYGDCRATFLPRVRWLSHRMPKWCNEVFPSLVDTLSDAGGETRRAGDGNGAPFRVLSVGTGAGEMNGMLLQRLRGAFPKIHCTVVEPSVNEIRKYENHVAENGEQFAGVTFEWCDETYEQFMCRQREIHEGNGPRYDFIEAVEAVYYMRDHEEALEEMYDSLLPGGLLLIIAAAENGGYHNLWKQHGDVLGDERMNFTTSGDVKAAFKKKGIAFSVMPEPNGNRVDITEVFDEDSDVGGRILDFLTHIYHFRKSVPGDIRDDLISLLKSSKCSKIVDDRVLFNNSFEATIVLKEN